MTLLNNNIYFNNKNKKKIWKRIMLLPRWR